MARRSPLPESFPSQLLEILRRGALGGVVIEMHDFKSASSLRAQLNRLKKSLRDHNHDLQHLADRTSVSLSWGMRAGYPAADETTPLNRPPPSNPPTKVTVQPPIFRFKEAFERAGISIDYADEISALEAELGSLKPPNGKH